MKPEKTISPISIAVFLFIFGVYLYYLCPSVYGGDSPLFYASAFSMGPAHPPSYPLYVLLGKLFTFIPFGSIPYKLNLFGAVCGALASFFVFKSVHLLTDDYAVSIFSALLSAFLPLAWIESVKAEVYTLNSLLVMVIFYLCLGYLEGRRGREALLVSSLILGLGMGNHHTIGFMLFPLIFAALLGPKRGGFSDTALKDSLLCAVFIAAGMLVYAFSYVRSIRYLSGGVLFSYSDAGSIEGLIMTFLRKEYGSSLPALAAPVSEPFSIFTGTLNTARYLVYKNMGLFSLFAVFLVPALWKKKPALGYSLVSLASFGVVLASMVFSFKSPGDNIYFTSPYMLPLLYLWSFTAGIGLWHLLKPLKSLATHAAKPIALGIVLMPLVFILPGSIKSNDLSDYYIADDFSDNLLDTLPPVSIVISGPDASYFPVFYKSLIERRRDDVPVLLGDKSGLSTEINPFWKYKALYPTLSEGKLFPGQEEGYVKKGRIFVFDVLGLPKKLGENFDSSPYIHTFRLFPNNTEMGREGRLRDFEAAFGKFVFERSIREKAKDVFTVDLKTSYFIPLAHYAYIKEARGDRASAERLYGAAHDLITPQSLAYYITYLKQNSDTDEIDAFLHSLEPKAQKYPEVRMLRDEITKKLIENSL